MRWFRNEQFEFETRIALGGVARGLGDAGEILATVERIKDGDYESWHREFLGTGQRVREIAERAAAAGHAVSARDAYLRAAAYIFVSTSSLDGTDEPQRMVPVWRQHRECFERFAALRQPALEKFEIPYEGTALEAWFFPLDGSGAARPTVIFNNGSDGSITDMWARAQGALARGYNAMTFDGPGQGQALWEQDIPFRPDWEKVIGPVLDALERRGDVDASRLALVGVSQGGYWVPRALAFEPRIAAAVADPGVFDVSTAWTEKLPKSMVRQVEAGERGKFERNFHFAEHFIGKTTRQTLAFRMKPYATDSMYEVLEALRAYRLDDVVERIETPLLITEPEHEQFWPGQSRRLYDALPGTRKELVRFSAAEGAAWHCEPMAPGLLDQRVFDWLDDLLGP
ncbi:MAG TPA: alpha/beta fold hydrolase [Solirubrobacterales bacterium]|nr:alpha/beta fold hydrolase [Solirubrobacterales bacterium]